MKKEFNLSEKIAVIDNSNRIGLEIEDVKEFIKILKEQIYDDYLYYDKRRGEDFIYFEDLKEIIDKLAGDKLK